MGRNLAEAVHHHVQAERLSLLALLSIQIGPEMDAPLREIEEAVSEVGANGYPMPGRVRRKFLRIQQAGRRARRAAKRLDEAFFEAFKAVRPLPPMNESSSRSTNPHGSNGDDNGRPSKPA